jgi:SAM-dependent methyltransferase
VRIVFIGGYARTGSTLLDRLIGQVDGFFSLGEFRHVWERCFLGNQLCGCGRQFHDCPFWQSVVDRAFGGFAEADAAAVLRTKTSVDSFWNIPRIATGGWTAAYRGQIDAYRNSLSALYGAIQEVSGARFLIDSTKDPQHAYILRTVPGFDVRMLHLVRDSRAVAYSWGRVRSRPEIHWRAQDMPRFPVSRTALAWDLTNLAAEASRWSGAPYAVTRYEDLVHDPVGELSRVMRELDLLPADLSFIRGHDAELSGSHTVAGNPSRFEVGTIALRSDDEWTAKMRRGDRSLVTALTWPLLIRYGYRRRTPSAGPTLPEMGRILRMAFRVRREPLPYARAVADLIPRYLRSRKVTVQGRWLDVGAGGGALGDALVAAGAERVVGLDVTDRRQGVWERPPFVLGSGERLPFANGSFDGVVSSNVLEHVSSGVRMIRELIRVCRPGGIVYLSWTNWFSPLGGHEWSPFHYLGERLGLRAYTAFRGKPPAWNLPGRTLFPVHIGTVLREIRAMDVQILDITPRYWPAHRWLARIPLLREVAMWNCVVLMRRSEAS